MEREKCQVQHSSIPNGNNKNHRSGIKTNNK